MSIIDKEPVEHRNGKPPFTRISDVQEPHPDQWRLKPFNLLKMKRMMAALATSTD
jgi:hypothetical protein